MINLPDKRYQIYTIEKRKVNNYAHINYKNNYYSVPYIFMGEELIIKSNDNILKIYKDGEQVAIHQISTKKGEFFYKGRNILTTGKPRKTFGWFSWQKAQELGEFGQEGP